MQNPYSVHRFVTGTDVVESDDEVNDDEGRILPDNVCTQAVEIRPVPRLGSRTTLFLLHASKHIEQYNDVRRLRACELLISSFECILQLCLQRDKTRWDNISWEVSQPAPKILQATSDDDHYFFYFQFFKRHGKLWLRVYYEGLTELQFALHTTQSTRHS